MKTKKRVFAVCDCVLSPEVCGFRAPGAWGAHKMSLCTRDRSLPWCWVDADKNKERRRGEEDE